MNNLLDICSEPEKEKISIIVRLTTSYWYDGNGLYQRKDLKFLKRKCTGYNFIQEDCNMVGADEVFDKIINLDECDDGIYQIISCNESTDWETGYIDDWDYKLVKYDEQ